MSDDIKPTISIDTKTFPGLPKLGIDQTVMLTLKAKVVSISRDRYLFEGDGIGDDEELPIHYSLEFDIEDVVPKKMSLEEAGERAMSQPLLVKNNINPAP